MSPGQPDEGTLYTSKVVQSYEICNFANTRSMQDARSFRYVADSGEKLAWVIARISARLGHF